MNDYANGLVSAFAYVAKICKDAKTIRQVECQITELRDDVLYEIANDLRWKVPRKSEHDKGRRGKQ
jgi:hypothetical protein